MERYHNLLNHSAMLGHSDFSQGLAIICIALNNLVHTYSHSVVAVASGQIPVSRLPGQKAEY